VVPAACTDAAAATALLTAAFRGSVPARLRALYQPTDGPDTKAREDLLEELEGGQNPTVRVSAVRPEAAPGGCAWVMKLDFRYTRFVGGTRTRSANVRMLLATEGTAARVTHLTGAQR
jgi:hypothetical protein